jgi:hypothetical protein
VSLDVIDHLVYAAPEVTDPRRSALVAEFNTPKGRVTPR